jgi:hypothetical protein
MYIDRISAPYDKAVRRIKFLEFIVVNRIATLESEVVRESGPAAGIEVTPKDNHNVMKVFSLPFIIEVSDCVLSG